MRSSLLACLLFLVGCGTIQDNVLVEHVDDRYYTQHYWDPALVPYVDYYIQLAEHYGVRFYRLSTITRIEYREIKDKNGDKDIVGYCHTYSSKDGNVYRTITIKKGYKWTKYRLNAVMLHELGHCVNNLEHSTVENSIMYESLPSERYLEENWDHAVEQFFDFIKNGDPVTVEQQ